MGPEPGSVKGVSANLEWVRDFLSVWEGSASRSTSAASERVLVLRHPARWARQDKRAGTRAARQGRSPDLADPGRQGDARGDLLRPRAGSPTSGLLQARARPA